MPRFHTFHPAIKYREAWEGMKGPWLTALVHSGTTQVNSSGRHMRATRTIYFPGHGRSANKSRHARRRASAAVANTAEASRGLNRVRCEAFFWMWRLLFRRPEASFRGGFGPTTSVSRAQPGPWRIVARCDFKLNLCKAVFNMYAECLGYTVGINKTGAALLK